MVFKDLDQKTAIVTGGTKGIGKAIACGLAAQGVNLAIVYSSDSEAANKVAKEIAEKYNVHVIAIKGDVALESTAITVFEQVKKRFGIADILVNNAGISPPSMIEDTTLEEWNNIVGVNLTGCFLFSKEMIKATKGKKAACIINMTSQAAYNGSFTGKSHYAATKGGIVSFTTSLAKEVSKHKIRVVAVAPGMVPTEGTEELLKTREQEYKEKIPMGRVANVKEIADAVVFLASDAACYITGTTLDVSGGMIGR